VDKKHKKPCRKVTRETLHKYEKWKENAPLRTIVKATFHELKKMTVSEDSAEPISTFIKKALLVNLASIFIETNSLIVCLRVIMKELSRS